jgi:hypothetical protein
MMLMRIIRWWRVAGALWRSGRHQNESNLGPCCQSTTLFYFNTALINSEVMNHLETLTVSLSS